MRANRWLATCGIAFGSAMLGGCYVAPAQPYYGGEPVMAAPAQPYSYYAGEPVMVAPPPPRVEVVGVAPAPGYVWIDGFWGWNGRHHDWHPGRWEAPRPGYRWRPHQWHQDGGHWRERRGHWERH